MRKDWEEYDKFVWPGITNSYVNTLTNEYIHVFYSTANQYCSSGCWCNSS